MKIAVLAGGVGGATFLLGVKAFLGWDPTGRRPADAADEVTAIVNTASDIRLHNLQICPDLDSCLYATSGALDRDRGWGLADETWSVSAELKEYGAEAPWFSLGDRDIATHLMRTRMLDAGYRLSTVTEALCDRWQPGVRLLPMSDDLIETHAIVADPGHSDPNQTESGHSGPRQGEPDYPGPDHPGPDHPEPSQSDHRTVDPDAPDTGSLIALHFLEWSLRYEAALPALAISPIGADTSTAAPGVIDALFDADVILVAPSNPVTSIGAILAVPGIRDAITATTAPVVGVSPIIAGSGVLDHSDACLAAIKVECSAQGVAAHYGARSAGGLLDALVISDGDAAVVKGMRIGTGQLSMSSPETTSELVAGALDLVDVQR